MARTLPVVDAVASEPACCAACAVQQASVPVTAPARPRAIRRSADRRLTFAGVLVAAAFLAIAAVVAALTVAGRTSGPWAALHLVLAGAAGCAIAAVLPFFTAALAQVAPASPRIRVGAIASIAVGTLAVTIGVSAGVTGPAALGGLAYLVGLGLVAVAVFVPLRSALGRRSTLVLIAYGVALAEVAIGVGLATSMVAGWAPVAAQWAALKPAHAWLNVFGFLSVVIAATLIHLAPTVSGNRIQSRRSSTVALVALLAGAPVVAIGFAGGWDGVARIGAILEMIGSTALVVHGLEVRRGPSGWTDRPRLAPVRDRQPVGGPDLVPRGDGDRRRPDRVDGRRAGRLVRGRHRHPAGARLDCPGPHGGVDPSRAGHRPG